MGVKIREKDGNWYLFINHKGVRRSKKVGKDKKLAKTMAAKIEAKLLLNDTGFVDDFNKSVPTFKKYGEKVLSLPHSRADRTQERYLGTLEAHVYPVLGNMHVDQIKRRHVKDLFNKLLKNGMAESTLINVRSPMNLIFNSALDDEIINTNPMAGIKISLKGKTEIKALTEDQAFDLLDQAEAYRNGLFYPHLLTLLRTGLRISELCGLKWSDIDFKDRSFEVKRQVQRGIEGPTKTRKSRVVDMTPHLTETLRALKVQKQKEAMKEGKPFSEWVFTFNGRKPVTIPPIAQALNESLKRAGLPHIRIHDLRHSYASIRILRGDNLPDVSAQLGHSSIQITIDTYTDWIPGRFKREVDAMDLRPNATQTQLANETDK